MAGGSGFFEFDEADLGEAARRHGFRKKGPRTWWRRTTDLVQVVNLQRSQWSRDLRYLNFALWPLALGEPPTLAESKFHFRTRAESLGARDLDGFFAEAERLTTLADLASALGERRISGLVSRELGPLLA